MLFEVLKIKVGETANRIQNSTATLEDHLVVFLHSEIYSYHEIQPSHSLVLSQSSGKLMYLHRKLYRDLHRALFHMPEVGSPQEALQ